MVYAFHVRNISYAFIMENLFIFFTKENYVFQIYMFSV